MNDTEAPLKKRLLCRDEFGDKIEKLAVNQSIEVTEDNRKKVWMYATRRYKGDRVFLTFAVGGKVQLMRVK